MIYQEHSNEIRAENPARTDGNASRARKKAGDETASRELLRNRLVIDGRKRSEQAEAAAKVIETSTQRRLAEASTTDRAEHNTFGIRVADSQRTDCDGPGGNVIEARNRMMQMVILLAFGVMATACSSAADEIATTQDDTDSATEVLDETEALPDGEPSISTTTVDAASTTAAPTTSEATKATTTTTTTTTDSPTGEISEASTSTAAAAVTTSTAAPTTTSKPAATTTTAKPPAATTTTKATTTVKATTTTAAPTTSTAAPSTTTTATPPPVNGGAVYAANCSRCHGGGGEGGRGPNLQGYGNQGAGIDQVTNGGGGMPSFSGSLSPAEIEAVVDHVINNF